MKTSAGFVLSSDSVLAFVPDLMFGSKVKAMIETTGLNCDLVSDVTAVDLDRYAAIVIDLTCDADRRLRVLSQKSGLDKTKTLAFYSHVENDIRDKALSGGIDMVVPRSRMAREGESLLSRLIEE